MSKIKITPTEIDFLKTMFNFGLRYFFVEGYKLVFCFYATKKEDCYFVKKTGSFLEIDTKDNLYSFLGELRLKTGEGVVPFYDLFIGKS